MFLMVDCKVNVSWLVLHMHKRTAVTAVRIQPFMHMTWMLQVGVNFMTMHSEAAAASYVYWRCVCVVCLCVHVCVCVEFVWLECFACSSLTMHKVLI